MSGFPFLFLFLEAEPNRLPLLTADSSAALGMTRVTLVVRFLGCARNDRESRNDRVVTDN